MRKGKRLYQLIACTDSKDAHIFHDKVVNECEIGRVKRNAELFNSTESTEFDNTSNPLNKKALYTIEREQWRSFTIWVVDLHWCEQSHSKIEQQTSTILYIPR